MCLHPLANSWHPGDLGTHIPQSLLFAGNVGQITESFKFLRRTWKSVFSQDEISQHLSSNLQNIVLAKHQEDNNNKIPQASLIDELPGCDLALGRWGCGLFSD